MCRTTAAKVVVCTLVVIVGATGALNAAAATTNSELTVGENGFDDRLTVKGGTVDDLITVNDPDTDVQLFLDLDQNGR